LDQPTNRRPKSQKVRHFLFFTYIHRWGSGLWVHELVGVVLSFEFRTL